MELTHCRLRENGRLVGGRRSDQRRVRNCSASGIEALAVGCCIDRRAWRNATDIAERELSVAHEGEGTTACTGGLE